MLASVQQKYDSYPDLIKPLMLELRDLVFSTAAENQLGEIEETLKWGEPAYLANQGSTFRMDWKAKAPDKIGLYFNCPTLLVETFRELFAHEFTFSGNRAILLDRRQPLPTLEITQCIYMTLNYHKIKHLPLLGEG